MVLSDTSLLRPPGADMLAPPGADVVRTQLLRQVDHPADDSLGDTGRGRWRPGEERRRGRGLPSSRKTADVARTSINSPQTSRSIKA